MRSLLLVLLLAPWLARAEDSAKPLKLLTIGNSFAGNAMAYFPKLAQAAGRSVVVFQANPGGCSLEKHAGFLQAFEANPDDPKGKPYASAFFPSRGDAKDRKYSLPEVLQAEKWDYVTIQQLSNFSFQPETYEPYATSLIDCIHQYAPQAKIVVFQTWAYREDYPAFKDGFTQQKMYDELDSAYRKLAADHHLQLIPVGYAFQNARSTPRWHFQYPDPAFDYKNPAPGALPTQPNSLNVGWTWWKSPTDGTTKFILDQKHANEAGKLLAAAVFYEALFNDDVRHNTFLPDKMDAATAQDLRRIAHESFASYAGPKLTAAK